MKDHSIYMTEDEWTELDKNIERINASLEKCCEDRGSFNRPHMTVYKWKFFKDPKYKTKTPVPKCEGVYYTRDHALAVIVKRSNEFPDQHLKMAEVESSIQQPLKPLKFMALVMFSVLVRAVQQIAGMNCPACQSDKRKEHPAHMIRTGCRYFGRDISKEYYEQARLVADDKFLSDVFHNCWKKMKLPITDGAAHLSCIQDVLSYDSDEDQHYMHCRMNTLAPIMDEDPGCMVIDDACKDLKLSARIVENVKINHVEEDDDEEMEAESVPHDIVSVRRHKLADEIMEIAAKKPNFYSEPSLSSSTDDSLDCDC